VSINVLRYLANYIDAGPLAFSLPSKKMYQGTVSVNVLRYLAHFIDVARQLVHLRFL
jgi:hypothetical protein